MRAKYKNICTLEQTLFTIEENQTNYEDGNMGFFSKLKGELIDIVEWLQDDRDTLAYRFERYGNEIKNGAQLTVREGQWACFVNEGTLADVFEPGMYTLSTQNLPLLSTLRGWEHGFNSPFKAEVYFISRNIIADLGWGTASPFYLPDPRTGADIEVTARGTFTLAITHPEAFIRNVMGTMGAVTKSDIRNQLRDRLVMHMIDTVGEAGISVFDLASKYKELGELVAAHCKDEFYVDYGLEIQRLSILNIGLPPEYREMMRELNRLKMMGAHTQTYAALSQADAMKAMASNPGGGGANMMGMGVGMAMANQMAHQQMGQPQYNPGPGAPPPPPPPVANWYAMVGGQQQGPMDHQGLQQLIGSGQVTPATMVWKQGMAGWAAASSVPELSASFPAAPPPPPPGV